jgi:hypothetical protein
MSETKTITIERLDHADMLSVKLTDKQAKFYHEFEIDGVKAKELVDTEFVERAKKVSDALDPDTLCLMGAWDINLFRTVLRKFRAEYDSNELRLEDIDLIELQKLDTKVDIRAHEKNVADIPKQVDKLMKTYKGSRATLAHVYNELTGREMKAVAFPRATSLYALRTDVLSHLNV